MRKLFILMFTTLIFFQNVNSQENYFTTSPTNTPNILPPSVSSFQKVNAIQVSNYTGRANVSVPFYEIKQDGINIPISLSYNTSGIKMNEVASNVGMNWTLNTAGVISKIVRGTDDFRRGIGSYYDWEMHRTHYITPHGWLSYYTKFQLPYMTDIDSYDPLPDIFKVNTNNLNFSFIHNRADFLDNYNESGVFNFGYSLDENGQYTNISDSNPVDGKPFILDGDNGTKIEEIYGSINCGRWGYDTGLQNTNIPEFYVDGSFNSNYSFYGIKTIKITTIDGIEYLFDNIDVSQYVLDKDVNHYYTEMSLSSEINVVAYHLSKITDLKTKKVVEFEYETYTQDFSEILDSSETILYTNCSTCSTTATERGNWLRYPKLNRLKKIKFDTGYLNFNYSLNRLDLPGDKALTGIELYDNYSNLIKKQNFTYDYYQSATNSSNAFTKRLRLLQVEEFGNQIVNQNGLKYTFTYNNSNLPPRNICATDLFGYHNGEANNFNFNYSTNQYVNVIPLNIGSPNPKLYFNINKEKLSFFHTYLDSNSKLLDGNYTLFSNLNYCKAGILEKITFPTGGYINLEYELNKYKIDNLEFEGGGLRVKKQIISDGTNSRTLFYDYLGDDNLTSGSVNRLPKRVKFEFEGKSALNENNYLNNAFVFTKYNSVKSNIELTEGSYVGYSKVKVYEQNKGFTVYEYSNPVSNPNINSHNTIDPSNSFYLNLSNAYRFNEQFSLYFDNDSFRGKLLKESIYNNSNQLLNQTINTYEDKTLKEILLFNPIQQSSLFSDNYKPIEFTNEFLNFKQFRFLLKSTINKSFFNGNSVDNISSLEYDNDYPIVKKKKFITSANVKETYNYYPSDSEVNNLPYINNLLTENRISELIQQKEFVNQSLTNTKLVNYNLFQNPITTSNQYLFKSLSVSKGNNELHEDIIVTKRDFKSNILEYRNKNNIYFVVVYGYNNTLPVATIENATYASIESYVANLVNLSNTGTQSDLINALNQLRAALPNAMITTYTHIPLVGVSSITDPKGDTVYYTYDGLGRLQYVKDAQGKLLTDYQYHYKN